MDIELFRNHCLQKEGVTEEFPFGENTLVYKVNGKIFALTDIDSFESINLKCDPEKAQFLRERYSFVLPGYHMNKKHWNTIRMERSIPDSLLKEWIDHSYGLVAAKAGSSKKKPSKR
ncbi:MAG: MmcQ/YjbR family DNA-binding protein [Bacteroidetes bacterium]|nr:MmcQ/YjbR family DNA-binding protein [Bacteroidota bacterium]